MNIFVRILYEILYFIIGYGPIIVYMLNVPRVLHFMQLNSYNNKDFIRWQTKNPKLSFKPSVSQLVATGGFYLFITLLNKIFITKLSYIDAITVLFAESIALLFVYLIINTVKAFKDKKERANAKKKLVYTSRAKRLIFWNFIAVIILEVLFCSDINSNIFIYWMAKTIYYSLFILTLPINMVIANFLASPSENFFLNRYINKAKRKLRKKEYKDLIKIGITGSFGKTSTKFILQTILSEKYNVLATPESYNTTNGNLKVINDMLTKEHDVLISEMGARYRYDISEICDFVKPQIGIITSIGPQHLESFKNIDNIIKTKSELINSLPSDGVVFLPNDGSHCLKLYNKEKRKKYIWGLNDKNADCYAKDIKITSNGSRFTAVTKNGNIDLETVLLGELNIQNILCAISVSIYLGLSNEEIKRGVSKLKAVEHRLQIVSNNNGVTVIDDAFNSNIEGSKMALDVLKKFDGRKIIITPGMVELGKDENKYNEEFGKAMADAVDIAILVGKKRSEPIVSRSSKEKF